MAAVPQDATSIKDGNMLHPPRPAHHKQKGKALAESIKNKQDESIMDTNNSSIVSKRSVEKLYYPHEPENFRHFVTKFKRRSPLINRGYWLRMKAIEHSVVQFLTEVTTKRKLVVNLGCGYDPLPFMFASRHKDIMHNSIFVDVDYPQLMRRKLDMMDKTDHFRTILAGYARTGQDKGVMATSQTYFALGCDLNDMKATKDTLGDHLSIKDNSTAILFVGEVSVAYMSKEASQQVLMWTASHEDVRFCLLEQHLPDGVDHPFAKTMLAHFRKIGTPLNAIGTLSDMRKRFVSAGWPDEGIHIQSLWELWSSPTFLTPEERRQLDQVEPFDEWEEFALFGSHYFLMLTEKKTSHNSSPSDSTSMPTTPLSGEDMSLFSDQTGATIIAKGLTTGGKLRRFAGAIPATKVDQRLSQVGFFAGIGAQDRRVDCDTYGIDAECPPIVGPPLRTGLACFTTTQLGNSTDCLFTGGRTSPDKASDESWIRKDGCWSRTKNMPQGRYRHCAVSLQLSPPQHDHDSSDGAVLIYGGKTSSGQLLDDWILWTQGSWQRVRTTGDVLPPRFGASMISHKVDGCSGILSGGMTEDGCVLSDLWHWSLGNDLVLELRDETPNALKSLGPRHGILGRFGAQLVHSEWGMLLIGGICTRRVLTRQDEILNLDTFKTHTLLGLRPLLIGCTIVETQAGLVTLGGGATCFSFGTFWSEPLFLTGQLEESENCDWKFLRTHHAGDVDVLQQRFNEPSLITSTTQEDLRPLDSINAQDRSQDTGPVSDHTNGLTVKRVSIKENFDFEQCLQNGRPRILTGSDLGPCTSLWTDDYLVAAIGAERKVVVHSANSDRMDFQRKNFEYVTVTFGDFMADVKLGRRVYLRALSNESPSDRATNLVDDYPQIANDFKLPSVFDHVAKNMHSSPLRISGPVTMWLHYDVMANVLCQIRGRKKLVLFPPTDVGVLGFSPGSSSSSLNVFDPSPDTTLALQRAHPHEAVLEPGDVLFIPPMWLHAAEPTEGESVAVNIFFRSLPESTYAAGRDVYGNRDLAPYERGRKDITRIIKSFEQLPAEIGAFYLERLGGELLDRARTLSRTTGS